MAISNPFELAIGQLTTATRGRGGRRRRRTAARTIPPPAIRRIGLEDVRQALIEAAGDVGSRRTDVLFLCLIYPVAGLVLAWAAYGYELLPLVFPLLSGFALIGPVAAIGLYEVSHRREQGLDAGWADAVGVARSPAFGSILGLSLLLFAFYLLWLAAAYGVYRATLGPEAPASIAAFIRDVFTTQAGWTMIVAGTAVGFLFAVVALAVGIISFPLLLDRKVSMATAVATSVRATLANPMAVAAWGLIVAAGLVIGSLPALVGLILVMPLLGHGTWRLYRKMVPA